MQPSSISQAVTAQYSDLSNPRMQTNHFIRALPSPMDDAEIFRALTYTPDYDKSQCAWPDHERILQIRSLANIMLPMALQAGLARTVDSMMREGYVGRAPRTKEMVQQLQTLYEGQKAGLPFSQTVDAVNVAIVETLLGISGMGKSTTLSRWLATYPRVIHHPDIGVVQVTYIHVDLSSQGDSVKALAIAVITQLDMLLPEMGYHQLYLQNTGRTSTASLTYTMARLLHIHHVGLLVADEVQNLCNSPKGAQVVMTELVTMCNALRVPILFVGTPKAQDLLSADFRMGRRATGFSIPPWNRLQRIDDDAPYSDAGEYTDVPPSEWADFVRAIWQYQWLRNPAELSEEILDVLYESTQGIIDLTIKMFAIAQVRAILSGEEILTAALFKQVFEQDLLLVHDMIAALATNDFKALKKYQDVRPIKLEATVSNLVNTAMRRQAANRLSKPGDATFVTQVAAAGMAGGLDEATAVQLAEEINAEGTAKDMPGAFRELSKKTSPKRRSGKHVAGTPSDVELANTPDLSDRPLDYRRALVQARLESTKVFEQLQKLGMARKAEELVPLD